LGCFESVVDGVCFFVLVKLEMTIKNLFGTCFHIQKAAGMRDGVAA
jgi:hypothetical protein